MKRFFDTAYVLKNYVNEPDSPAVRALLRETSTRLTSIWNRAELACALHRQIRERVMTSAQAERVGALFESNIAIGAWQLVPFTDSLLHQLRDRVSQLPASVFIRAGDAIQLASALHAGADEIWSNDRHLLNAASHFGLAAKSV